ncbi:MAG: hypothetical protein Q7T61_20975 [Caulobacter sp.]|nr:hypothetical protein [Caulobacter sp.]
MTSLNDETLNEIFGAEDAENEAPERLKEYFYRNKAYESLRASLPLRILVGHKGVGKSALLKVSELEDQDSGILSIWITPSDVSKPLSEAEEDFNRLIDIWKSSIKELVVTKAWQALGVDSERPILTSAINTGRDIAALLVSNLLKKGGDVVESSKRIVYENFLKSQVIRIYIDDLDRGWQAKRSDIRRISALLTALRDICGSDSNLQIRLALRTDVYFLVRTSDESTDKIERNIIWLQWTNQEILVVIAKRISTFFGESVDDSAWDSMPQREIASKLHRVAEAKFSHAGKWENAPMHRVLLSLTRRRPRDLIKLLYGAGKHAHRKNHTIITTSDFRETFESYSNERLQDIINEFKSELPKIDQLLKLMKPTKKSRTTSESYSFTKDALIKKIKDVRQNVSLNFTNGDVISDQSLANFLYKIDFITAKFTKEDGFIDRKYFDQNRLLQDQFFDDGYAWEIHPAYRWALQPSDINTIIDKLELEGTDSSI